MEDLIAHMTPVDLVLVEGFKTLPLAKIEVRAPENNEPTLQSADEYVVAVIGDQSPKISVPTFGRDDIGPISDFIGARVAL